MNALHPINAFSYESVKHVAFSPDGTKFMACNDNIKIWDADTYDLLFEINTLSKCVIFSQDSTKIFCDNYFNCINVYNASTGKLACQATETSMVGKLDAFIQTTSITPGGINNIVCSPDNQKIVTSHADHGIKIWDIKSGALLKTLNTTTLVSGILFMNNGTKFLSYESNGKIIIWDSSSGEILSSNTLHNIKAAIFYCPAQLDIDKKLTNYLIEYNLL